MSWFALGTLLHQDFLEKAMKYVLLGVHVIMHTLQQAMQMMGLVTALTRILKMFVGMLFVSLIKRKGTKRKGKLVEYFQFCHHEYQFVLKHVSVRWLSLACCLVRILKKFPSLRLHFVSEDFRDERFWRLNDWFSKLLLEPALVFNQCALCIFTKFSLLLQRAKPTIHLLKSFM